MARRSQSVAFTPGAPRTLTATRQSGDNSCSLGRGLLIIAFFRIAVRLFAALVVLVALVAPAGAVPLSAPVLTSPGGKSHADTYLLKGTADSLLVGSVVRILRNGTVIDSVAITATTTTKAFSKRVPLLAGDNSFRALQAFSTSTSPKSNTVVVHFDTAAGFFMPVPMVPGASFDVNTVDPAAKVELRIFDTAGDLVIRFDSRESRAFYSWVWDGKNGSGQSVRRGPLVAVAAIDYPDGTHEIVRQVFLFDPKGTP